jgi:hypothetical protein
MSFLDRLVRSKVKSKEGGNLGDMPGQPTGQAAVAKSKWGFQSKKVTTSAMDAAPAQLVANEDGTVYMAFGLRWRTLVTSGGRQTAQKIAQTAKATHYIFRSQQVGYAIVPKQIADAEIYPASVVVAKMHTGAAIFALRLGEGTYWFAVVRNGQPTNADEVLNDLTDVEAVARVRMMEQQFEGEALTIVTDIPNSGIAAKRTFTVAELFELLRLTDDRLEKLAVKKQTIPAPVIYATLAGALLFAGQMGYKEWQARERAKVRAAGVVIESSPEQAWAPVVTKFFKSAPKPGFGSLKEVRRQLGELPVLWSGWKLAGARCQAQSELDATGARSWNCHATYEHGRVALTSAEMQIMAKARQPSWSIKFPTIYSMTVSWIVQSPEQVLASSDLGDPMQAVIQVASALQFYFPALPSRPEFKMAPFELPAPKRADGAPHPKPASVPALFKGDIALKGPLRTMDALAPKLPMVRWDAIGLVADPTAEPEKKGLVSSSIAAELVGMVYGKQ